MANFNAGFANRSFGMEGGFMNSPGAPDSASKGARPQRAQNVVPVCVAQVLAAPEDGPVVVGDTEAHMLSLVVVIKSFEQATTKISYTVADNTGSIEAIQWLDADMTSAPVVRENTYCSLFATFKTSQKQKMLMAYKVAPITDFNLLTTHLLSVIYYPLKLRQITEKQKDSTMNTQPVGGLSMGGQMNGDVNTSGIGGMMEGMTPMQQLVYKCIRACLDNNGIHRNEIMNNLRGKASNKDILNALEYLSNEGHVYTTLDEDHYQTTE